MSARLLVLLAAMLAAAAAAGNDAALRDAGSLGGIRLAGSDDPEARKVYIVQLASPAAADYHAAAVAAASRPGPQAAPRVRFDKSSAAVEAYAARLTAEQDRALARAGADVELIYRYYYGLNGFAAKMQPAQAHKLGALPGVLNVWEDEIRPLAAADTLEFLGLFDAGDGLRVGPGLDGEDIIIGVIDSGVYPEHPALRDVREADRPRLCQGSWAENSLLGKWLCHRYEKRDDVLMFEPPGNWNGDCQAGEQFEATLCNNKLIGARYFGEGARNSGPIDDAEVDSARDLDGHGTHTATTAAGNRVEASVYGSFVGRVEGVAPRARVAVYKACWLRPGDQRASCNTSDLANAVDAAVADGVDIINYSVGNSMTTVTSPDDVALMAAARAGILAVVAAGNEGPALGTIGSPAGGPWVITAAASTHDGSASFEAIEVESPPGIAGLYAMKEANFTPRLEERGPVTGNLVPADDEDDSAGTTDDACEPLTNSTEMNNQVAFIQRGGCRFDTKIANAADAGAVAAVVYSVAGDPTVMSGEAGLSDIPAVMIGQADGNLVRQELDDGNAVAVRLDYGVVLMRPQSGNEMATFSARGPAPVPDILKPDVTAPGVNVLAGFTPEAANSTPDEKYAYLSGTSMATPHVAGVAALLMQSHPNWTPAMLKSALMTTAHQSLTRPEGEGQATPLGYGAGHIVPNDAIAPGLVYDVRDEEYEAFACGIDSPAVTAERCDELQAAGHSFEGADLNQPSIAVARLAGTRTVTRRVTNVDDESATWVVEVAPPPGIRVDVVPPTLSVLPGESATFDVTFTTESAPLDAWALGALRWTSGDRTVHSSLAIRPISVTAPAQVTAFGASGSLEFAVEFGYTGSYSPGVHGLRLPLVINGFVDNDPSKTFSFRTDNGVTAHLVDVPQGEAYLRFALFDTLTDGDDDLDLYVYFCADNVNCVEIGESGSPTSQEEFNVLLPQGGRYAVLVHGFETDEVAGGPGANYQLLGWSFGLVDDQGNMTAAGPGFVNAGTTDTVTVDWAGLLPDTIYLGGISHNTPRGLSAITVIRIGN